MFGRQISAGNLGRGDENANVTVPMQEDKTRADPGLVTVRSSVPGCEWLTLVEFGVNTQAVSETSVRKFFSF